jgi:tetratricopeptide (TPR) repeat protein
MATSRKTTSRLSRSVRGRNTASRRKSGISHNHIGRRASTRSKTNHRGRVAKSPPRPQIDPQYQAAVKNFETAVRAFQKQDFGKAAAIFTRLAESEARDVAERAQMHLRLCRQKTGRQTPLPKSADDYYTLGVACFNARQYQRAVEHLSKADKLKPRQEHVQYALAVSHAQGGNIDAAFAHLESSFALRPENRIHARRDEDLQGLAGDPRFQRLIHPERM